MLSESLYIAILRFRNEIRQQRFYKSGITVSGKFRRTPFRYNLILKQLRNDINE